MDDRELDGYVRQFFEMLEEPALGLILPSFGFNIIASVPSLAVTIGSLIRQYRIDRQLTQAQLAAKMHMDKGTVSRHEHGQNLSIDVLPEYAESLGVDVQKLFPQGNTPEAMDERQRKINRAIDRFQKVNDLPDDKLDQVLDVVNAVLNMTLDDVDTSKK